MTQPIVFVGPSITPEDRKAMNGLDLRGPAEQGDVLRALEERPVAIGLIDGYFEDRLAVHQKEIIEAIFEGIPVYGAASMGALRAAELQHFGMHGLGEIFTDYCCGHLTSDAEVAVTHGPADVGYPNTSLSLVDVRATLNAVRTRSFIPTASLPLILDVATTINFRDRTWAQIARLVLPDAQAAKHLAVALGRSHVERKRLDALKLLRLFLKGDFSAPKNGYPPPMTKDYVAIRKRALGL